MKEIGRFHRGCHRLVVALVASLLAQHLAAAPAAAVVSAMKVSQTVQLDEPIPSVRVFVEALDENGRPGAAIQPMQLSATLGQEVLELSDVYPFKSRGQGVAYVFLVDISASLSLHEFELILEALDVWILSLRPADRVAVIAFGNESKVVVDFTRNRTAIQSALYALGPSDNKTVLHEALKQGLELCSRRDADLPGRRVMIILTDGRDEGSGLTTEDILASLRRDPVPIYAIGVSRIKNLGERRRYLDLLGRFAANSGGSFHEASTAALGAAYESIRQSIHGVSVADFACPSCRPDGEEYRLQVQLEDGGRVLSSGQSLRLFPSSRPLPATPQVTPPAGAAATPSEEEEKVQAIEPPQETGVEDEDARSAFARLSLWAWLLVAAVLVAGGWLLIWHRRPRSGVPSQATLPLTPPPERPEPVEILAIEGDEQDRPVPVPVVQKYTLASGAETTRPPRPAIMRLVRLIVVRGEKPGRQYALTLFKNAVVGSRSTCDCVLVDPGVAPQQFEILQRDGRVYIRNLARANPTLIDGLAVTEQHPMKSGELVGNRDFIVRIVYEDARPINT